MKLIITEKIHEVGIDYLKKFAEVDCEFGITREELLEKLENYDAMIVRVGIQIDKEVIDRGKNLKAIGMAGIGLNHIDVEYAREKGIAVFNVPEGSNDSVAELTIALMLNIARKIYPAVKSVKVENQWDKHTFVGRQLKDKVLGIVALGKIGSRVARISQAFGMHVIAYDPFIDKTKAEELNVELVELDDLLSRADFVSIHAPLTKQTYHLIGQEQISRMKKGAFLINLGRGGVVDEESLYNALKEGHLAGAAVDVMEKEPPGKSQLFELENFVATPHIGAGTIEAQEYISKSIAEKVLKHLKSI